MPKIEKLLPIFAPNLRALQDDIIPEAMAKQVYLNATQTSRIAS